MVLEVIFLNSKDVNGYSCPWGICIYVSCSNFQGQPKENIFFIFLGQTINILNYISISSFWWFVLILGMLSLIVIYICIYQIWISNSYQYCLHSKIKIISGNFYVFIVRNIRMETYGAHWIVRDGKKIMMVISEYLYDSKKHWFVLNLVMWKTKGKATLKHQCVSSTAAAFYHIAT